MAKAAFQNITDTNARKFGDQKGLETLLVQTVNYECKTL